jgi:hypothetical protein
MEIPAGFQNLAVTEPGTRLAAPKPAPVGIVAAVPSWAGSVEIDSMRIDAKLRCRIRICVDVGQDVVDHDALASQSLCAASDPDPVHLLYGENTWLNLIYLNDIFDCWRRICDWIDARTYFECAAQN